MTLFEFLLTEKFQPVITLARAKGWGASKYQFYFLVRHLSRHLKLRSKFVTVTRANVHQVLAQFEERALDASRQLYAVEGVNLKFFESLRLPSGSYVVTECEDGELAQELYANKDARANFFRLLCPIVGYPTRSAVTQDWSGVRGYEEVESALRYAAVLGLSAEALTAHLATFHQDESLLEQLKRGHYAATCALIDRYSATWAVNHLLENIVLLARYRAARRGGVEHAAVVKALNLNWGRARDCERAAGLWSDEELLMLGQRLVALDGIILREQRLGLEVMLFNLGRMVG